jgi:hypothetical protein
MMKFKNMITATVVLSLFFLFTVTGFCAEDGKVTMEQWLKIINSGDAKKSTSSKATETNNNDIDSTTPSTTEGIAVTVYWHMADDADVYLNGKPLRYYEPSFKTRGDEAPQAAFSASAILNNGDVFTVGGRRGGSFGFMLIAVDSSDRVVFKTDQQSWKVYEPGDRADWYNQQVAMSSPTQPVTVQPDPWYPQKELNKKFGDIALSIWGAPSERFSYLTATVSLVEKKKAPQGKRPSVSTANEIKRDGRFVAYDDGTVLDTKTNLMWAARDNGSSINWQSAKSYCENYHAGGYTDWRMPTQDELAGLYDTTKTYKADCNWDLHLTELIHLTCTYPLASETRGSEAAGLHFDNGLRSWYPQSSGDWYYRALPVRSGK